MIGAVPSVKSMKGATYSELTDSLEAIRNRLDALLVPGVPGATFDTATDSLEAIRNRLDAVVLAMEGATFSTGTDSLEALRDRLDAVVLAMEGATFDTATDSLEKIRDALVTIPVTGTGKLLREETSAAPNVVSCTAAGANTWSSWVQWDASLSVKSQLAIVTACVGQDGPAIIEVGIGAAGSEVTIFSVPFQAPGMGNGYEWTGIFPLSIPREIASGVRVAVRYSGNDIALTYTAVIGLSLYQAL